MHKSLTHKHTNENWWWWWWFCNAQAFRTSEKGRKWMSERESGRRLRIVELVQEFHEQFSNEIFASKRLCVCVRAFLVVEMMTTTTTFTTITMAWLWCCCRTYESSFRISKWEEVWRRWKFSKYSRSTARSLLLSRARYSYSGQAERPLLAADATAATVTATIAGWGQKWNILYKHDVFNHK